MTRGKQKIDAQKRNAEKNSKSKGSQLEHRAVALKVTCPICKILANKLRRLVRIQDILRLHIRGLSFFGHLFIVPEEVQIANQNQLVDHYSSKHPKEKPPSNSE